MLHSGARFRSAAATRCSCGTSRAKATRKASSRSPPLHKPDGHHGRPGLPVPGHHRLVGPRRRGAGALPLQRPRSASRLGRQLLRHPAIPDRQLRPLLAYTRHPPERRHLARRGVRSAFLMLGDKTDIKAGTVTRAGRGHCGQELEPFRATHHGRRSQVRRTGRGLERRRPHARSGVQRARERRQVHAQPAHDRDHPRAAVLGPGYRHQGELYPAVQPRHRRATGEPLGEGNIDERRATIYIRAKVAVMSAAAATAPIRSSAACSIPR